jgi:DNA invertase Pin-like site-specific DNA recombinase
MPLKRGTRFGAYHRVSQLNGRDPDADNYITEDVAWEQIDAWATMHKQKVQIADHYLDRDVSGKSMDRPELNRMLDDLRSGRIDGIAVAKVDRLSRADVGDALKVVAEIDAIGKERGLEGSLAILDLGLDPATDTGEMILGVLLVLARWQWKRYKRQWADAQKRAVERAVWMGPPPFGYRATVAVDEYDNPKVDKHGNPVRGPLESNEDAKIVTKAYLIAASEDLYAAMAYLEEAAPDKRWRKSDVRRLLASEVYLGVVRHGKHVAGTPDEPVHPPLTTLACWTAAQTEPQARRTNGVYPLTGLVECSCGGSLVGGLQTQRGRKYRRMRCGTCERTSISADKLETYVRDMLAARLEDGDGFGDHRPGPDGLGKTQAALAAAEAERTRYAADLDIREDLGDEAWRVGARARSLAVEQAQARYQAVASQTARTEALPAADELTDPDKLVAALRGLGAGIVVRPGRGRVQDRVIIGKLHGDDVARPLAA